MTNANAAIVACLDLAEAMERLRAQIHRWYQRCAADAGDLAALDDLVLECSLLPIGFG